MYREDINYFVIGSSRSGKTTFINKLKGFKLKAIFDKETQNSLLFMENSTEGFPLNHKTDSNCNRAVAKHDNFYEIPLKL